MIRAEEHYDIKIHALETRTESGKTIGILMMKCQWANLKSSRRFGAESDAQQGAPARMSRVDMN